MSKKIYVKAPFVFSQPGTPEITNPVDGKVTPATPVVHREFAVGEHEIPPEIADHPWIVAGADGAIETDEEREDRLAQEEADKVAAEAQAKATANKTTRAQAKAAADMKKAEAKKGTITRK